MHPTHIALPIDSTRPEDMREAGYNSIQMYRLSHPGGYHISSP
ncbi:hypothetical protein [Coleofasciculus sp. FACHB-1120]|nr:hypothetical protein [Coleofasciculus sp. FACHB-1120]